MSRYLMIAWGCAISRDPAENTANHQRMIDELNAEILPDGWPGVTITRLETANGSTHISIEPGEEPLTLDLLRRAKAEFRLKRRADDATGGQLSLAVA